MNDIEKLRASLLVNCAILQAIIEEWPADTAASLEANISSKLEQFTVRSLNSTMPEAFVEAQRESALAWASLVDSGAVSSRTRQSGATPRQ